MIPILVFPPILDPKQINIKVKKGREGKVKRKKINKKNLTDSEQRPRRREVTVKEANRRAVGGEGSLDGSDDFGIVANVPNRR